MTSMAHLLPKRAHPATRSGIGCFVLLPEAGALITAKPRDLSRSASLLSLSAPLNSLTLGLISEVKNFQLVYFTLPQVVSKGVASQLKIVRSDMKRGLIQLDLESPDDLWHCYNIIRRGDTVYSRTSREVKSTQEGARPSAGKRFSMTLGLRVEKISLDRDLSRLKITGVVIDGPEKFEGVKGSHHTFNLAAEGRISIIKEDWLRHDIHRIESSSHEARTPILVVAIDDEEYAVGILREYGFDVKTEFRTRLPGKRSPDEREAALNSYVKGAVQSLQQHAQSERGPILIVGPGFTKNRLEALLQREYTELAKRIARVATTNTAGVSGLNEALKIGVISKVLRNVRAAYESELVEAMLSRIGSSNQKVAYGFEDVSRADAFGAIDTLLVSSKFLQEIPMDDALRAEGLIRSAEQKRAKIVIVSSEHEAGRQLTSLGGIGALLRFPIYG